MSGMIFTSTGGFVRPPHPNPLPEGEGARLQIYSQIILKSLIFRDLIGVRFVWLLTLLWALSLPAWALEVVDDRGHRLHFDHPPQRVVSLAPHATELIYAIGAGAKLVAVSAYSDYPIAATKLPVVTDAGHVDIEQVLALKADVAVAWGSGNRNADIERLESLGIPVYVSELRSLQDIGRTLTQLGRLLESRAQAQQVRQDFEASLDRLRKNFQSRSPVRVFFQIESRPLMTLGGLHLFGDLLDVCGGINLFADLTTLAPVVGVEDVIQRDPQLILVSDRLTDLASIMKGWRTYGTMTAIKHGRLYGVPADLIVRPTPRIVAGVEKICELVDRARQD